MSRRRGEFSITFMSGPLDGKTLRFNQPNSGQQRIIEIGRREGCDIYMPFDNQVSRLHARLICSAQLVSGDDETNPSYLTFYLEDGSSRNGTFIEKQEQPVEGQITLRPGILFRIGRTWMRLDVPISY